MIKITIGTNTSKKDVLTQPDATPRQLFEQEGIDYKHGVPYLDGGALGDRELDQPFSNFDIIENRAFLIVSVKSDSAAMH